MPRQLTLFGAPSPTVQQQTRELVRPPPGAAGSWRAAIRESTRVGAAKPAVGQRGGHLRQLKRPGRASPRPVRLATQLTHCCRPSQYSELIAQLSLMLSHIEMPVKVMDGRDAPYDGDQRFVRVTVLLALQWGDPNTLTCVRVTVLLVPNDDAHGAEAFTQRFSSPAVPEKHLPAKKRQLAAYVADWTVDTTTAATATSRKLTTVNVFKSRAGAVPTALLPVCT